MINLDPSFKAYPVNSLDLDQDVIRRLTLMMSSISKGSEIVLTTPLCKSVDPKVILERFNSQIFPLIEKTKCIPLINLEKSTSRSLALDQ